MLSFRKPAPELPDNITSDQLLSIMSDLHFTEEEKAAYMDISKRAEEYQQMWKDRAAQTQLIKEGLKDIEISLNFGDILKLIVMNPVIPIAEAIDKAYYWTLRPAIALVAAHKPSLIGEPSKDELYALVAKYQQEGINWWESYAKAYSSSLDGSPINDG